MRNNTRKVSSPIYSDNCDRDIILSYVFKKTHCYYCGVDRYSRLGEEKLLFHTKMLKIVDPSEHNKLDDLKFVHKDCHERKHGVVEFVELVKLKSERKPKKFNPTEKQLSIFNTIVENGVYELSPERVEIDARILEHRGFIEWRSDYKGMALTELGKKIVEEKPWKANSRSSRKA